MSDESALDKLKQSIEAIQSHRDYETRRAANQSRDVDAAWEAVLSAARELRDQFGDSPSLRYFVITRDQSEVSVRFAHNQGAGTALLSLYRRHPDGKFPAVNGVWILEPGKQDRYVTSADEAVEALVRHCAINLTRDEA